MRQQSEQGLPNWLCNTASYHFRNDLRTVRCDSKLCLLAMLSRVMAAYVNKYKNSGESGAVM